MPTISERLPRTTHLFNLKFSEVSLEQLLLIITKLHVEVTVEASFGVFLGGLQHGKTLQEKTEKNLL